MAKMIPTKTLTETSQEHLNRRYQLQSTAVQILWAWAHGRDVGVELLRYGATIMYDRKRHAAM